MDFKPFATGHYFLEAPRADGDMVWFSDGVGGLFRARPDGAVDSFLPDRTRIGGAAINRDGAIICSGAGGLAWLDPATGRSGTLLEDIDGRPIPVVNDIFPDGRGGLYFGTSHVEPPQPDQSPPTTELYRLDPGGRLTLLWDGLCVANGIGLSPDGRRLYLNESWLGTFAYDVAPGGTLANRTPLSPQKDCDGLAVDREGGIWIACFETGAILRMLSDGRLDRRVPLPVRHVTSLCFGGPDGRDLYVTTGGNDGLDALMQGRLPPRTASLYHARCDVAGLPVPHTAFCLSKA